MSIYDRMDNPFADPAVLEAQRAASQAPIENDNPFAEEIGNFLKLFYCLNFKLCINKV